MSYTSVAPPSEPTAFVRCHMSVYEMVRSAIIAKRIVVANYNGHRRLMCPHAIGRKNGKLQGLFYQFGGSSSQSLGDPGSASNWRCIPIDGLTDVDIQDGDWHTAFTQRHQSCI